MSFAWTALVTPWDGTGYGAACIKLPSGRIVVGGASGDGTSSIIYSDDGGATWTPVSTSMDVNGINALAYSAPLGILVAVGSLTAGTTVIHSTDGGATWVDDGDPFGGATFANCVAWDTSQALFVAGCLSTGAVAITSPDGLAWTAVTTPLDGDGINAGFLSGVMFSASAGKWLGVGRDSTSTFTGMTSPDAVTWSLAAAGPFDGLAPGTSGLARSVAEDTVHGLFIAAGSGSGVVVAKSPDFATWTLVASPGDGSDAQHVEARAGAALVVLDGGPDTILESSNGGAAWANDPSSPLTGAFGVTFLDDTHALAVGTLAAVAALGVRSADTFTWTNEGPQIAVDVAPGLNPGSFTPSRTLGLGESRSSFDPLVVESQQTQAFNVRLVQHGASAVTEIYSVDIDLRPLPSSLLGETA